MADLDAGPGDVAALGQQEQRACVRAVHVQPHVLLVAHGAELGERVHRAARGGAQRGEHDERDEAQLAVLLRAPSTRTCANLLYSSSRVAAL